MLGIGALFLLFVLLYSQRVASQSCETLGELLHHPDFPTFKLFYCCVLTCSIKFVMRRYHLFVNCGLRDLTKPVVVFVTKLLRN